MAKGYKALKEDFVSNLSGGSIWEVNVATAVAPAAVLLWSVLQARRSSFIRYGPAAFATDFLLNVGGILMAITLYSGNLYLLHALIISPALILYFLPSAPSESKKPVKPLKSAITGNSSKTEDEKLPLFPTRPFVTSYRGTMMIVTCLAILAVDFRIFPRRFAKVETWGTSLMDMGVGSFVFSAGLVGVRPQLKDQATGKSSSLGKRLVASASSSIPLLVLGFVRLYSVKGLDYAEHVSEYGMHWNFFFTLGFLPPFVAVFQSLFRVIPSYARLSLLLACVYQALLEFTSLKAYILAAPRDDLLSKNREGIFSFIGYLAIYLAGQHIGQCVLPRDVQRDANTTKRTPRVRMMATLVFWTALWSTMLFITVSYNYGFSLRVSRRLANLPYVLWVSAFNSGQILFFCAVETLVFPTVHNATDATTEAKEERKATSRILKAYNRNGLAIFLLANLMTGLVNLTIDTLRIETMASMGILVAYALVFTAIAVALDARNISIKLSIKI
ncbi:MAG: Glucosaminyl phosphatidylinositol (GlcN-PI) nositol acylation protein [Icmadophila ericetorum]|nr:Glucosaminyl phosphatidylinositol (GlcN-PI) nositol acylation protein [Icmadophila ericetorum]